jgi:hypothetical protein
MLAKIMGLTLYKRSHKPKLKQIYFWRYLRASKSTSDIYEGSSLIISLVSDNQVVCGILISPRGSSKLDFTNARVDLATFGETKH